MALDLYLKEHSGNQITLDIRLITPDGEESVGVIIVSLDETKRIAYLEHLEVIEEYRSLGIATWAFENVRSILNKRHNCNIDKLQINFEKCENEQQIIVMQGFASKQYFDKQEAQRIKELDYIPTADDYDEYEYEVEE